MAKVQYEEFDKYVADVIEFLKGELKKIRSGRASASLVEDIKVDAYGDKMPIKNVANINVVDAQMITIQPWDKGLMGDITKAIQQSNIGINPIPYEDTLQLKLPVPSQESRIKYVKAMKEIIEETKVKIRGFRHDVLHILGDNKKNGVISEDDYKRKEKEIQLKVDNSTKQIDEISKAKEEELMTV